MGKYDDNPIVEGRYDAYGRQTYWAMGYKGKGVKVGVIDNYGEPHGHQMASVGQYIAPEAEIIKLDMKGDYYSIIDRLKESIGLGVHILSISRSVDFDTKPMHDAIKACRAAGITIFCSAGNTGEKIADSVDIRRYPAAYPEVISVLALDNSFMPSAMSSHGSTADITGFGQNILVRNQAGEEMLVSGTSPTTAACAFTAALYVSKVFADKGKYPAPSDVELFIGDNVVDVGVVGRDNLTGHGFFTLDRKEFERVRLMILDSDKNGLSQRVDEIKAMVKSGMTLEQAESTVNSKYYVVGYETINGIQVPVYGGKKPW